VYAIATVVYGVPVDEVLDAYARAEDVDLERLGFELLYSGSSDGQPGYLGVVLCDLPTLEDYTRVADLRFAASAEEQARAEALLAALPEDVRAQTKPIDTYIIWSTS
jgi:hypothetical protein